MLQHSTVFLVILVTLGIVLLVEAKTKHKKEECNTVFTGCKRRADICECDKYTGCKNPFDFETLKACQASMYTDPCRGHRKCYNGGWCLQKFDGGYACKCSGTGYYGDNCEKVCPEHQNGLMKLPKADYENAKACIY
ncbi:cadherin EGF LAG seven-pass G-type receptor 2-like [Amphiura filiformis]|uniref:cadherin EGF LAG seven-pass G-type receptor 2-like n=1 Tax=Amphiura filiformis TaxID=82378 RepID=UPI003B211774